MVSSVPADMILERLAAEERRAVREFNERLRALLGVRLRDLRLFGSKVRGDAGPESDIDVLVLIDNEDPKTVQEVWRLGRSINPWISPLVWDFDKYHAPANRANPFYKEMRKESVRL